MMTVQQVRWLGRGAFVGLTMFGLVAVLAFFYVIGDDVQAARTAPTPLLERSSSELSVELGDHVALIDCKQVDPQLAGLKGRVYVDQSEPKVIVLCASS